MLKICTFGAASQDVFLAGKGIRSQIDPETNEHIEKFRLGAKLNVENMTIASGGGATNAAVTFARQGLDAAFIGKMGDDAIAHGVLQELDSEHVSTNMVVTDDTTGTQYSTILLTETGERTILIFRGAAGKHRVRDYHDLDFSGFDWLYVSSLAGSLDVLSDVFRRAKESDVKIAFNPGDSELKQPDKLKALLEDVEVLIVNKEEMQQIVHGETIEELAKHGTHVVPTVIVSDGPNGVAASDGKTLVLAGMYQDVEVIDRTGAGDAFGSGFLSQWVQGKSLKESIIFASANSTSVVTHIGAKKGILHKGEKLHEMPLEEKEL